MDPWHFSACIELGILRVIGRGSSLRALLYLSYYLVVSVHSKCKRRLGSCQQREIFQTLTRFVTSMRSVPKTQLDGERMTNSDHASLRLQESTDLSKCKLAPPPKKHFISPTNSKVTSTIPSRARNATRDALCTEAGRRVPPHHWAVYDFIRAIPAGKVSTYKDICSTPGSGSPRHHVQSFRRGLQRRVGVVRVITRQCR